MTKKNGDTKTLQVDIVKRFMSDEEWYEFRKEYLQVRHSQQGSNRAVAMNMDINPDEKEILAVYTQDTDLSIRELNEKYPGMNVAYRAGRTALKIIHQHPEILQRI